MQPSHGSGAIVPPKKLNQDSGIQNNGDDEDPPHIPWALS
jgi:hypothetical protein